jgi:hypothetical protein
MTCLKIHNLSKLEKGWLEEKKAVSIPQLQKLKQNARLSFATSWKGLQMMQNSQQLFKLLLPRPYAQKSQAA